MTTVTRPAKDLEAVPAEVVSLQLAAGKLVLCICLLDNGKVIEQKVHTIPLSGTVIDQDGTEIYASVPATVSVALGNLIDAVSDYVDQAATDNKL